MPNASEPPIRRRNRKPAEDVPPSVKDDTGRVKRPATTRPGASTRPSASARAGTPRPGASARPKSSTKPAPSAAKKPLAAKGTRASTAKGRKPASRTTMKKVGRTLRAGSASTVLYTRRAVTMFNAFTHSAQTNVSAEQTPLRRVVRFFATLTFPLFLVLMALVVAIAVMAFSNSTLTVDQQKIAIVGLSKDLEGFTIMQVTDLHAREFGSKQRVLAQAINNEKYDLLVFTGDMVGISGNPQPFYDLLEGLTANRKRFFIAGDSDPSPVLRNVRQITGKLEDMVLADWALGAQQRGATYLARTTQIPVGGNVSLWLSPVQMLNLNLTETMKLLETQIVQEQGGVKEHVEADRNNLPLTTYRYHQLKMTQEASGKIQVGDVTIALSHIPPQPDFMSLSQKLEEEGTIAYLPAPDIVLAGHYCGGVWKFPMLGAPYIPNALYRRHGWFPNQNDVEGQKLLGLSILYTSPGLGVTDDVFLPNFRLMNPPTISLITLTGAVTDNLLGD